MLGRSGMVGHVVYDVLSRAEGLVVEGTDRQSRTSALFFDAREGAAGLRALWRRSGGYEYAVNCIGVTKAAIDERDPTSVEAAIRVNALLPHELASVAAEFGTRVLHLSTDGVFSGAAGPCAEDTAHDCADVYGKTKSLGEVSLPEVLTVRCSVIGPDTAGRRGLLEWFLSLPEGKEVTGYTDSLWNGVTTFELARLFALIIQERRFDRLRNEAPIHHFCSTRAASKFELLTLFRDRFERNVRVNPGATPGGPVTRTLVTRYQGLRELFGWELELADAVAELALERTAG